MRPEPLVCIFLSSSDFDQLNAPLAGGTVGKVPILKRAAKNSSDFASKVRANKSFNLTAKAGFLMKLVGAVKFLLVMAYLAPLWRQVNSAVMPHQL